METIALHARVRKFYNYNFSCVFSQVQFYKLCSLNLLLFYLIRPIQCNVLIN
jgi:hypothetical protein